MTSFILKVKKLNNKSEGVTHEKLNSIASNWNVIVYPKVGLKDVIEINPQLISDKKLYNYGLMAHFDFVVYGEDEKPLFVVEFDGPTHENNSRQIENDKKKDYLCKVASLPILRIKDIHLEDEYRNMDMLTYIVENYFMTEAFYKEQDKGNIPPDECFDIAFVIHDQNRPDKFPYWLSLDAMEEFRKKFIEKSIRSSIPSIKIYSDEEGTLTCICYVKINNEFGVYYCRSMKYKQFPYITIDFVQEICCLGLLDKLKAALNDPVKRVKISDIDSMVKEFEEYEGYTKVLEMGNINL